MPWTRPTLGELIDRNRGDFKSRLGLTAKVVRRRMSNVLAVVWGGAAHMMHGHLEWLSQQLFADTAERAFLLRQASLRGVTPTPATYASGTATATGLDESVIQDESVLVRDDGFTYRMTDEAVIDGTTATVNVEALTAGAAGNLDAGETLSFESPILGVESDVVIDGPSGLAGGVDEEGTEGTRSRFIDNLRDPPQGGAEHDYEAWAKEVAGVTRAWVYRWEGGLGTIVVRFVIDGADPIIPTEPDVEAVQTKLDSERPVNDDVTAVAPTALPVDFDITLEPNTTASRDAVEAELDDLLFRRAEPGDGEGRGTILLSQVQTAIGVAVGDDVDFEVTDPVADVVPELGQLPVLGTVSFDDP